jgi:hypothetical protein
MNVSMSEPFGQAACESEIKQLKERYRDYYFYHTRFNAAAMDPEVYLIIGRRGAGKTALSHFFSFQKMQPNNIAIDVNEPVLFEQVMAKLADSAHESREIAIPGIVRIWEFVVWSVIFRELKDKDPRIKTACLFGSQSGKVSLFIRHLLKALLEKVLSNKDDILGELEALVGDERFKQGMESVLEIAKKHPVYVAFDTLENYDINDDPLMRAMAGLIQFASDFNMEYSRQNLHLKLFIMAEVFPHLKESVILNTAKFVRNEIYLHWRPKDLMRLITWRFYQYLKVEKKFSLDSKVDWENHKEVLAGLWEPFFGKQLTNGGGLLEKTFPYMLRHTQMRPRQLIILCNSVAKVARRAGTFPYFEPASLVEGVGKGETSLADEVLNSYVTVYPNAARIVDALSGIPTMFKGKELDRRAPHSAGQWPRGEYSPDSFRQLVVELGIVGRVRKCNEASGYVEGDFEYACEGRLPLLVSDDCVIHPMFYKKLNVQRSKPLRVYPFPDDREYRELEYQAGS